MQRRVVIIISSILIISILIVLVELGARLQKKDENKVNIVATIFPAYDFARAIAGNSSGIDLLVKPGVEVHSYDPSPMDIVKIQNASMFIYIGGENEEWVEEILDSIDTSNKVIIKLMDYVEVLEEETVEGMQVGDKDVEEKIEYDEHIWTDPKNAIKFVEEIAKKMEEMDEKNSEKYKQNAQNYIEQIKNVDEQIEKIVKNARRDELVFGDRFPFRYLTNRYNLKYSAAFPGCSTETEASSGTLAYLIQKIKEENIPVVIYIEMSTRKIVDILTEETGTKAMLLHSCQNVSKKEFVNGVTYVSIMKENLNTLKEALN